MKNRILHLVTTTLRLTLCASLGLMMPEQAFSQTPQVVMDWREVQQKVFPTGVREGLSVKDLYQKLRPHLPPDVLPGTDFYFNDVSPRLTTPRITLVTNKILLNSQTQSVVIEFVKRGDVFARLNGTDVTTDDFLAVVPLAKKMLRALDRKSAQHIGSTNTNTLLALLLALNPLPQAQAMVDSSFLPFLLIALAFGSFYLFRVFGPITPRSRPRHVERVRVAAHEVRPREPLPIPPPVAVVDNSACEAPRSVTVSESLCDYSAQNCILGRAMQDFNFEYEQAMDYFCGEGEIPASLNPATIPYSLYLNPAHQITARTNLANCIRAARTFREDPCSERRPSANVQVQPSCGSPNVITVCGANGGTTVSDNLWYHNALATAGGVQPAALNPCAIYPRESPVICVDRSGLAVEASF